MTLQHHFRYAFTNSSHPSIGQLDVHRGFSAVLRRCKSALFSHYQRLVVRIDLGHPSQLGDPLPLFPHFALDDLADAGAGF